MAIVSYGPLVDQISGSVGQCTFSAVRGKFAVRRRANPTRRKTPLQQERRKALSHFSGRWIDVLTAGQRAAWDAYGATCTFYDALGKSYTLNGFNMYVRNNIIYEFAAPASPLDDPPESAGFPPSAGLNWQLVHADGELFVISVDPDYEKVQNFLFFWGNIRPSTQETRRPQNTANSVQSLDVAFPELVWNYGAALPGAAGQIMVPVTWYNIDSYERISKPTLSKPISE